MIAGWRAVPGCTSCGREPVVSVARGSACAPCLGNLCADAVGSWKLWFVEEAPATLGGAELAAEHALTHSDLGLAYAEMGLTADALAECVIAVASSDELAARSGAFVLGHLSCSGWDRFASGICRGLTN